MNIKTLWKSFRDLVQRMYLVVSCILANLDHTLFLVLLCRYGSPQASYPKFWIILKGHLSIQQPFCR